MKRHFIKIFIVWATILVGACNAASDRSTKKDSATVPSTLDTMKTPIHPGMVDSTGTPRLRS